VLTNQLTTGRDFDEIKVSQIQKKVTTADGVVALYGEPDRKEIVSADQVMWHYTYSTETHQTKTGWFAPVVEDTSGYHKNLDILLQNDVVINYTYVKVPIATQKVTSGATITN
jgi:hypothetical protein